MDDINIVILSGIIVGTPDVREIGQKKTQVCTARLKSVRSFEYNGQRKESSTTKDLKAFGNAGKALSKLSGGNRVRITGRLATESWVDKNDATKKHYKEIIECSEVIGEVEPITHNEGANLPLNVEQTKNQNVDEDVPF